MKPIKKKNVKMKNLIGIINDPLYEDLLFEIVQFLDNTNRYDGEFKMREVSLFTRVRINSDLTTITRPQCNLNPKSLVKIVVNINL